MGRSSGDASSDCSSRSALSRYRLAGLLFALAMTTAGDSVALVVLALMLSNQADSMTGVSLVLVAGMAPGLFLAPVIGRVVDAIAPGVLLCGALVAQGVIAWAMVVVGASAWLFTLAAVLGALGAATAAALMVLVPFLVPDRRVLMAISTVQTSTYAGLLAGPAMAALLVSRGGPRLGLMADGISFLVAATATALLPDTAWCRRPHATDVEDESPARWAAWGGFQVLATDAVLRRVVPVIVVALCAAATFNVALVFHVRQGLGISATAYAILVLTASGGLVAGPTLLRIPLRRFNPGVFAMSCSGVLGAAMVASVLVPRLAEVAMCLLVMGIANGGQNVAVRAAVTRRAPENRRGAVSAAYLGTVQGAFSAGYLIAGWPPASANRVVIIVGGAVAMSTALVGLWSLLAFAPPHSAPSRQVRLGGSNTVALVAVRSGARCSTRWSARRVLGCAGDRVAVRDWDRATTRTSDRARPSRLIGSPSRS